VAACRGAAYRAAGGSAFRAIAGYGRHGVLHEQTFFELAGNLLVQVVFFTTRELAEALLTRVAAKGPRLVYSISETEFGITEPPAAAG